MKLIFALLMLISANAYAGDKAISKDFNYWDGVVRAVTYKQRCYLEFDGGVANASQRAYRRAYDYLVQDTGCTPDYISLNSKGGDVVTGIDIGNHIRLVRMATFVPADKRCNSACVLIFIGGTNRYLQGENNANLGLHSTTQHQQCLYDNSPREKKYIRKMLPPASANLYILQVQNGCYPMFYVRNKDALHQQFATKLF